MTVHGPSSLFGTFSDRNNLYGSIPEDFCLLKDLKVSKLSGNRVTLPSCAFKLSQLEMLDLRGNDYAGRLPSDLHSMPALKHLELSENKFTGPVDALFPLDAARY